MKKQQGADSLPEKPMTETELEMMNVIWKIGPCTVNQILASLPTDRPLAYTSVSTIVRILEQKGYVSSEKVGRGHIYNACVAKSTYQQQSIQYIVRNVFDDTPSNLVRQLIDSKGLNKKDLSEIRKLLEEHS